MPRRTATKQTAPAPPDVLTPATPPVTQDQMLPTMLQQTVGTPPMVVRDACRRTFLQNLEVLQRIIDGKYERQVTYITASGRKIKVTVTPTVSEVLKAMELLAKTGGLQTVLLREAPPTPADQPLDLNKLPKDQLQMLERIMAHVYQPGEMIELMPDDTGRFAPAARGANGNGNGHA